MNRDRRRSILAILALCFVVVGPLLVLFNLRGTSWKANDLWGGCVALFIDEVIGLVLASLARRQPRNGSQPSFSRRLSLIAASVAFWLALPILILAFAGAFFLLACSISAGLA